MPSTLCNPDRRRFNSKVIERAKEKLKAYDEGAIRAIALFYTKHGKMFKIEVGKRYRLVSSDCRIWILISHESYNGLMLIGK